MKLVIDRSKWFRGRGGDGSRLRRAADGMQCCLGFLGTACGVAAPGLVDVQYPVGPTSALRTARADSHWPLWLFKKIESPEGRARGAYDHASHLAIVNDDMGLSSVAREEELRRLFAEHGVEVEFVDGEQP